MNAPQRSVSLNVNAVAVGGVAKEWTVVITIPVSIPAPAEAEPSIGRISSERKRGQVEALSLLGEILRAERALGAQAFGLLPECAGEREPRCSKDGAVNVKHARRCARPQLIRFSHPVVSSPSPPSWRPSHRPEAGVQSRVVG